MRTYIIHVSDAYSRKKHMQNQLKNKSLDTVYILEGDKETLTQSLIDNYFEGKMASKNNATSCAYKHILAYQNIAQGNDNFALILEDDIRFYSKFSILEKIVAEVKERKLRNVMISLEDSELKYIPRSERIKNVLIYPKQRGRLAGAYLIDKEGANNLLRFIKKRKVDMPIDWFHNECVKNNILHMFWSHPALAVQGSLDGSIESLIDKKKHGYFRIWSFIAQKMYKRILYFIR